MYLKISEIAKQLRVSQQTVRALIDRGELPCTRIATCERILESDLKAYLDRNSAAARTQAT